MSTSRFVSKIATILLIVVTFAPPLVAAFNEQTNQAMNSLAVLYPNMTIAQRVQYDQLASNSSSNETDTSMMTKIENFVDSLGANLQVGGARKRSQIVRAQF